MCCQKSRRYTKFVTTYLVILMLCHNNRNNESVVAHRGHVTNWLISKPNEVVACEKESVNLMCDHYQGIRVTEAFWGRDNDMDCQVDDPLSSQSHHENFLNIENLINLHFLHIILFLFFYINPSA